ncbi:WD40-repeat-containing domain protein [Suillus subluteus]|nr:WD40-repeat-containing domain protein [Suillus subluteus]
MTARFFARQTPKEAQWETPILKHMFEGHEKAIRGFVFLHDDIHVVSGSEDGTMRKWNCDTGLVVGEPWKGDGGGIYALTLSPNGKIIACGRGDGSVQRWNTNGEMIEGVWTGHSGWVRSLSWSPNGDHIASGSDDRTILIRRAESGKVEVGPINTEHGWVYALAYSPLGERIASAGYNAICIWNAMTGELVVGPIKNMGTYVTSVVWSSDSTKLYSASDKFVCVFDSETGKLLHRFEQMDLLYSVALSPKHNILACVGNAGVTQLWNTVSHQPLDRLSFYGKWLLCVSFSRDGRYVACGGDDNSLILWMVKDIARPQPLPAPTLLPKSDRRSTQQETRSNSPSSSCLDADATGGNGFIEEAHDDPYNNFFQSSQQSLPSPSPGSPLPNLFLARHFWKGIISRRHPPLNESVPQERSKYGFFSRRARSNSSLELATIKPNQPVPEGKAGEGEGEGEGGEKVDDHGSMHDSLSATKDKGKQRNNPFDNTQSPPSDDRTSPAKLDNKDNRNLWGRLMHAREYRAILGTGILVYFQ